MKDLIILGLALLSSCVSLIYFISTFDTGSKTKDEVNPENDTTYKLIRIFGILLLFIIMLYAFIAELIK